MRNITRGASTFSTNRPIPGRLAVWNRRFLIAAAVLILWAASFVALDKAGPEARALLAGEGMLINPVDQN